MKSCLPPLSSSNGIFHEGWKMIFGLNFGHGSWVPCYYTKLLYYMVKHNIR